MRSAAPFPGSIVRHDMIQLIPSESRRILEVGCGEGKTGKILREKGFEEIVGIEINEKYAREGKANYDRLIIGDVEKIALPYEKGHFDCILYGDVLEHLMDPWQVLENHSVFLKSEGVIICSIPNIRHYRIIKKLVFRGKWEYQESGIMDRTHLRFFTLHSIQEMLEGAGFEIKRIIRRPAATKWLKGLNRLLRNRLINLLVRQYILLAVKRKETGRCPAST